MAGSSFGYRVLGFGTVLAEGDWAPTISAVNHTDKSQTFAMGFDTSSPTSGSSFGSISDSTINGMTGSGGGGEVSLIRATWLNWDGNPQTFGIKFSEAGAAASTQQTGWTSITINSVTFERSEARSFNANRGLKADGTGGTNAPTSEYNNQYEYSWYATNPFGTTSSGDFSMTIDLG